jgi:hypothetical protein
MLFQNLGELRHEHNITTSCLALDLDTATVTIELRPDVDEAFSEVNVIPGESKPFTDPQAGEDEERDQSTEVVPLGNDVLEREAVPCPQEYSLFSCADRSALASAPPERLGCSWW